MFTQQVEMSLNDYISNFGGEGFIDTQSYKRFNPMYTERFTQVVDFLMTPEELASCFNFKGSSVIYDQEYNLSFVVEFHFDVTNASDSQISLQAVHEGEMNGFQNTVMVGMFDVQFIH